MNKTINRLNEIITQKTNFVAIKYSFTINMYVTECSNISIKSFWDYFVLAENST